MMLKAMRSVTSGRRLLVRPSRLTTPTQSEPHSLRQRSARLETVQAERRGDRLTVAIRVDNLAGHKLPTAHPSRRAWLCVHVHDREGQLVFVSGEHDQEGRILGSGGRPLASERAGGSYTPHRQRITSPDEVQIYEAVLGDASGEITYSLMRAARYLKDNRILPRGYKLDHPSARTTGPVGTGKDEDFKGGQDQVIYDVQVPADRGPFKVEAWLHYQTLGIRYAAELFQFTTREVTSFRRLYEATDRTPETLAEASSEVP